MAKVVMPHCVGDYDVGDAVCDGDPNDKDDKPCTWRDRCAGFQAHLTATGSNSEDFVGQESDTNQEGEERHWAEPHGSHPKFLKLVDKQVERYGVKDGKVTKDPSQKAPKEDGRKNLRPTKKAKEAARKALTARKMDRRNQLQELFKFFSEQVGEALPEHRFASNREAVAPGRLHLVDRLVKSGYISIYCKTPKGRDAPLALAKFKPRNLTLDVELPVFTVEINGTIGAKTLKKLEPKDINDGLFKCVMVGLDREGCVLAAEAIGRLVSQGKIELPEA